MLFHVSFRKTDGRLQHSAYSSRLKCHTIPPMRTLGWQQCFRLLLMNPSPERIMSTAAVSSSSLYQELQTFYQDRKTDLTQLGQALQAGDLTDAQTAYNALTTLGQSGPFANSEPFHNTQREQDFTAIGQALQSGDLAGAQQ